MTIDWAKPLAFAGDGEVEIEVLATDMGGDYPVLIRYRKPGHEWATFSYTKEGRLYSSVPDHPMNLINPPARLHGWINVYGGALYATREEAARHAGTRRFACIPVSFAKGEGL